MGMVFWITGLPGAGKSTIGKLLYERLRQQTPAAVLLDGDALRDVLGVQGKFSSEERLQLSLKYGRLCKLLSDQGIDVVCATVSMSHACRKWNRAHISNYREIFIRVPLSLLVERDQKQLYSKAVKGEIKNVLGIDLPVEEPLNPDLIIDNIAIDSPEKASLQIYEAFYDYDPAR